MPGQQPTKMEILVKLADMASVLEQMNRRVQALELTVRSEIRGVVWDLLDGQTVDDDGVLAIWHTALTNKISLKHAAMEVLSVANMMPNKEPAHGRQEEDEQEEALKVPESEDHAPEPIKLIIPGVKPRE